MGQVVSHHQLEVISLTTYGGVQVLQTATTLWQRQ